MNSKILLLAFLVAAISSCTTAYKTGQTPDDVYYSPARPQDEYVQVQREDDRQYRNNEDYYDDRYLRMKVHNRTQWSDLDDWYYYDNRYNYTAYNNWNNPWSPNAYWNYCYNPYYNHGVIFNTGVKNIYSAPRTFNLNTYNNNSLTNNNYTNPKAPRTSTYSGSRNVYNTNSSSNRSNPGSFLRNVFNNNSSSNTPSSSSSSSKSSSSSSSSSSSGGSSSGSTAPVRRFQ